ncbi:MRPL63 [Auxenochlorella protothecoides x Auxenochlorella symbiontica]
MVAPSRILCFAQRVKKTSGGRAWLPKWGLTGLNQTQKATRRRNRGQEQDLAAALKQAAAGDPKALEQAAA